MHSTGMMAPASEPLNKLHFTLGRHTQRGAKAQSAYCPAALMIGAQRSISPVSIAPNASGVALSCGTGSVLMSLKRAISAGSLSAVCSAAVSF